MKPWLQVATPALSGALTAAAAGFAVAPCHVTFRPSDNKKIITTGTLAAGWQTKPGADAEQIRMAFANGANAYLIACGPSGIVVADLDVRGASGIEAWRGKQPGGLIVATPSGGRHHYYRNDAQLGCPASGIPGVDIKGIGGGVFGPGSLDGAYQVLHSDALPPWSALGVALSRSTSSSSRAQRGFFDGPDSISAESADRSIAAELTKVTEHAHSSWAGFRSTLMRAAYVLGGYVGSDYLTYDRAVAELLAAISTAGHAPDIDDRRWIDQGLEDGAAKPLAVRPFVPESVAARLNGSGPSKHLPNDFWAASDVLSSIRAAAHHELLSPDTVLHAAYALLASYAHHEIRINTGLRAPMSLNYLALLCSAPSGGKTESYKLARRLLPAPADPFFAEASHIKTAYPIGSGEGLIECFMDTVDQLDPNSGKFVKVKQQVRNNALFYIDEGGQLNALMRRIDGTVSAVLRSMWGGEEAGMTNASAERRRLLPAGSYSLGLIVGYQPDTVADLLSMVGTGLPQRFAWADALVPGLPEHDVANPGPLAWQPGVLTEPFTLALPASAAAELRSEARAVSLGRLVRHPLDGHYPSMVSKMAALLALLHSRREITQQDWDLAKLQWRVSCAVRDTAAEHLSAVRKAAEEANSARYVAREVAKAAAVEAMPGGVLRVARRWARYVAEHGVDQRPERDVDRWLGRDRVLRDAALDHAKIAEWIIDAGAEGLRPGPRISEGSQ